MLVVPSAGRKRAASPVEESSKTPRLLSDEGYVWKSVKQRLNELLQARGEPSPAAYQTRAVSSGTP